jgi:hypothetical protein
VIEVHREEWKPRLAVGAGDVTQLLKKCGLIAAKLTFDPRRIARLDVHTATFQRARMGTSSVAICTNDVALFELSE